jgi:hypothetical protein
MPMGIVSDTDFETEKSRLKIKELPSVSEVIDIKRGRGPVEEVPDVVRETIAKCAINGEGTAKDIADTFAVSESSVSAYKVGAHSTSSYNEPSESLLDKVTSHKNKISRKARARLIAALNHITDEKLQDIKAIDLSTIAKNMAAVVKNIEPPAPDVVNNNQSNVQFVFMAPRVKDETEYRTITVND